MDALAPSLHPFRKLAMPSAAAPSPPHDFPYVSSTTTCIIIAGLLLLLIIVDLNRKPQARADTPPASTSPVWPSRPRAAAWPLNPMAAPWDDGEFDYHDGEYEVDSDFEVDPVGVTQEVLDSLLVFTYNGAGAGEGEPAAEAEQCSICLCDFEESEEGRQLPRCKHKFHRACVDPWLLSHGASCPLCRTEVARLKAPEAAAAVPSIEPAMEMV